MIEAVFRIISLPCLLRPPVLMKLEHSSLIEQVKYCSCMLVFKGICPLGALLGETSVFLILGLMI